MEGDTNASLAPPVVQQLRAEGGLMERSLTSDIREGREDLREAAEQTLNVILDLGLNGIIRWVSPSWVEVVGTMPESVQGKPIAEILLDQDKEIFSEAVTSMRKDDSRSQIIRFNVEIGPASKLTPYEVQEVLEPAETPQPTEENSEAQQGDLETPAADNGSHTLTLEGQGIMVYDRATGDESHVSYLLNHVKTFTNYILDYVDAQTLVCTS